MLWFQQTVCRLYMTWDDTSLPYPLTEERYFDSVLTCLCPTETQEGPSLPSRSVAVWSLAMSEQTRERKNHLDCVTPAASGTRRTRRTESACNNDRDQRSIADWGGTHRTCTGAQMCSRLAEKAMRNLWATSRTVELQTRSNSTI